MYEMNDMYRHVHKNKKWQETATCRQKVLRAKSHYNYMIWVNNIGNFCTHDLVTLRRAKGKKESDENRNTVVNA